MTWPEVQAGRKALNDSDFVWGPTWLTECVLVRDDVQEQEMTLLPILSDAARKELLWA